MKYKITKPNKNLSSSIFAQENPSCELYEMSDGLYISGCNSQAEAEALIEAHNPPAPTEPTIADKLASVGLSLDELKSAILGGN